MTFKKIRRGELCQICTDEHISVLHRPQLICSDHNRQVASRYSNDALNRGGGDGTRIEIDGDNNVCTHLARNVDWQIIDRCAVGVDLITVLYRSKECWYRHGRAQGMRQRSGVEDLSLTTHQLCRNTTEGNWQIVEAFEVVVRK